MYTRIIHEFLDDRTKTIGGPVVPKTVRPAAASSALERGAAGRTMRRVRNINYLSSGTKVFLYSYLLFSGRPGPASDGARTDRRRTDATTVDGGFRRYDETEIPRRPRDPPTDRTSEK